MGEKLKVINENEQCNVTNLINYNPIKDFSSISLNILKFYKCLIKVKRRLFHALN